MSSTHSVAGFFGVPMFICAALKQLAVRDWLWAWGAPRQLKCLRHKLSGHLLDVSAQAALSVNLECCVCAHLLAVKLHQLL